jgi:hypothetical protein
MMHGITNLKVRINVTQRHKDMGGVEIETHAFLITTLSGSKWLPNPTALSSVPTGGFGTRVSVHFSSMKTI